VFPQSTGIAGENSAEKYMTILMYLFVCSGALLALLSLPMILGKIPPNGLYGFRVKKTMENPDIWYRVNTYSGKWLLCIGVVTILTAAGLYLVPGIPENLYAYAILAIWVIVFSVAIIKSARYMNSL
jgi:uncharacterized membrane protein